LELRTSSFKHKIPDLTVISLIFLTWPCRDGVGTVLFRGMSAKKEMIITSVSPSIGVPEGELVIQCRGFRPGLASAVLLGDAPASISSASEDRIIVRLPESPNCIGLALQVGKTVSPVFPFNLATRLITNLHPVANPVVASDGSLISTISGGRGQQISQPLVRITRQGDKIPFDCEIMNPTGLAFSEDGQLYITSRNDGTVLRYTDFETLEVIADDLGVPCGIAFDSKGVLYVGDRTGKIYRIDSSGNKEEFVNLEPSIAAYHLAVDAEDRLYVTGPTFSMRDNLYRISGDGTIENLVDGLARPQGMVFLPDGDLLIAAGYQGKKGVFRYSQKDGTLQHFVAAPIMVGLAVSGQDIYFASGSSIYWARLSGQNAVN
jgi:sugar lactone lactonase YvrE